MSPEIKQNQSVKEESIGNLISGLNDRYETTHLVPEVVHEIPTSAEMSTCNNQQEGVFQFLRALVKAGEEFFAITDVLVIGEPGKDIIKGTAITQHRINDRANLIGFFDEKRKPITIGRNHQEDLKSTTSREHFTVALAHDGSVGILDLGSKNGTDVYTSIKNDRKKFGIGADSDNPSPSQFPDPAKDIDFWSAKSAVVKEELLKSKDA
jgi:hypothetical protein